MTVEEKTLHSSLSQPNLIIIAWGLIWWIANTVSSIGSKSFMIGPSLDDTYDITRVTEALNDLRWIDLTVIQLAVSVLLTTLWINLRRVNPNSKSPKINYKIILMASFGNLVGHLATNVSYAAISSSTTQVIKACEPVVMFVLLFVFKAEQKYENRSCFVLVSLLVISTGTCLFVVGDSAVSVWGILAALLSTFAYPIRNIYVKQLCQSQNDPILILSTISRYALIFIFPMAIIKLFITKRVHTAHYVDIIASASASHVIYNITSVHILKTIDLFHHVLLNSFQRIFVITFNVLYFSTPLRCMAVFGFVVLLIGILLCYQTSKNSNHPSSTSVFPSKTKGIIYSLSLSIVVSIFFFNSNYLFSTCLAQEKGQTFTRHSVHNKSLLTDKKITLLWVYERPLPESIFQNINTWRDRIPGRPVHVYCGSFHCVKAITDLKQHSITASFLQISEVVEDTTFQTWFTRHPLNKVLEGANFEDHLQQVVLLALTWRYGGTYIDPRVTIRTTHHTLDIQKPWIILSSDNSYHHILGLFNFVKEHSFISVTGQEFVDQYTKEVKNTKAWPMVFQFREIVLRACRKHISFCPKIVQLQGKYHSIADAPEPIHNFATFSYDSRVRAVGFANLSDEIQGFPGLQFVPFIDEFLETDELGKSKATKNMTSFFNAWWASPNTHWPPPEYIDPILLSMHIGNPVKPIMSKNIDYLRRKSPIGCWDSTCLEFLNNQGVEAFLSGGLTLLLKNPTTLGKRTDKIYLVDVSNDVRQLLPPEIQKQGILLEHDMKSAARFDKFSRFKAAYDVIEKYSTAKLVITQHIQSALTCIAMRTPIIFINFINLPGGGGTKNEASLRLGGISELCYFLDLYKLSNEEAKRWLHNFDWTSPRPVPFVGLLKRLRATSWNVIRKKKGLHEAAIKFGVVPFQSFIPSDRTKQRLFHVIFTTNDKGYFDLLGSDKITTQIKTSFTWRHWRCIESVFYHYPLAKVIFHSNTIKDNFFDVLKESGYDIEIRRYTLTEMVKDTPAESFMHKRYEEVKSAKYWYSHETDLLRMAILYKFGGVYMDTDVIIVRSLKDLPVNVVAYETKRDSMNGAFMYFEKKHPFLKTCLERFANNYDPNNWAGNGPGIITNILHSKESAKYNVTVLDTYAFYMFEYGQIVHQCFQETSGKTFDNNWKTLREKAFVVHLYAKFSAAQAKDGKLKTGTICKHIMNSFCVLCDKTY